MPALFCLGMQPALIDIQRNLRPDEFVVAYLDDVYLFSDQDRARDVYDLAPASIFHHGCVRAGETEFWSKNFNDPPRGIVELNQAGLPPVWKSNSDLGRRCVKKCHGYVAQHFYYDQSCGFAARSLSLKI